MIEDEVKLAMQRTGCTLPVVWGEAGLHDYPDKLRAALNEMIADNAGAEHILLAYSLCGNGMVDVFSESSTLVVPRIDDCVWMALCNQEGAPPEMDNRSLYYTRGWLSRDSSFGNSYQRTINKYGPEKAKYIYRLMLANYQSITLLDTGAYPVEDCLPQVEKLAGDFELGLRRQQGSVRMLEKLFSRKWDEEFVVLRPGRRFQQQEFLGRTRQA